MLSVNSKTAKNLQRVLFFIGAAVMWARKTLGMTGLICLSSPARIRHLSQNGCCYLVISDRVITLKRDEVI